MDREETQLKVEVLFPEFCNLYGDRSNMTYLQQCIPEAEFIETTMEQEPSFVSQDINLIYLGPMTEKMQEKVIKKLSAYTQKIQELIEKEVCFLFTGNAFEILGKEIQNEDGSKIEGLGIFPLTTKRDMMNRYNEIFLGEFEKEDGTLPIVGFKSQFTFSYGDNESQYFAIANKGTGLNKESKKEGIRKKNFFGTYLIGPILILNPFFTQYLLSKMGVENPKLAFSSKVIAAYEQRLAEFKSNRV